MHQPDDIERIRSDALFAARLAFLRWKADFLFERSKESYRRWRLKAKYDPDQPRVPAGQPGGGRWVDGPVATLPDPNAIDGRILASNVIWICEREGHSRAGDGSWSALYRCAGGQAITRSGTRGHAPPFLRDPFRR